MRNKLLVSLFLAAFCTNLQANYAFSDELISDMKDVFHLPKKLFIHDEAIELKESEKESAITNKKTNINRDVNVSLSDFIKSYPYGYSETLLSTLATIADLKVIELDSYNSAKGEIKAKLVNGKRLYIVIFPSNDKLTYVRVTPADGVYDIPDKFLDNFFRNLNLELIKTKNS